MTLPKLPPYPHQETLPRLLSFFGGLVLAGQNNAEATSTSTSAGDRLTATLVIPIATSESCIITANLRKSAGAANSAAFGLTVNSTTVQEADANGWLTSTTNQAESGLVVIVLGPQVANYLRAGFAIYGFAYTGSVGLVEPFSTADMPNAAITSIAIRGISNNALITHAVDELRVYRLPAAIE